MSEVVAAKSKPLFTKKHELLSFMKKLKKVSIKAIETLESALDSEDEKIRVQAAIQLSRIYIDTADKVRQDEIKAILLDVKANGLIGAGSTVDDDMPLLDFNNISDEFKDVQVVDMSDVREI